MEARVKLIRPPDELEKETRRWEPLNWNYILIILGRGRGPNRVIGVPFAVWSGNLLPVSCTEGIVVFSERRGLN